MPVKNSHIDLCMTCVELCCFLLLFNHLYGHRGRANDAMCRKYKKFTPHLHRAIHSDAHNSFKVNLFSPFWNRRKKMRNPNREKSWVKRSKTSIFKRAQIKFHSTLKGANPLNLIVHLVAHPRFNLPKLSFFHFLWLKSNLLTKRPHNAKSNLWNNPWKFFLYWFGYQSGLHNSLFVA